jgi:hypothetical protein
MKTVAPLLALAMVSIGCGKDGEGIANKAGEKLGQQVTDFTKGVGKGIDQKMSVDVSLLPEVKSLGLTNTIAKSLGLDTSKKGISVYFIASQSFSNTLVARALSGEGLEVGRCKKLLSLQKDEAAYVTFEFDSEMDSAMVKKYTIGL